MHEQHGRSAPTTVYHILKKTCRGKVALALGILEGFIPYGKVDRKGQAFAIFVHGWGRHRCRMEPAKKQQMPSNPLVSKSKGTW